MDVQVGKLSALSFFFTIFVIIDKKQVKSMQEIKSTAQLLRKRIENKGSNSHYYWKEAKPK
jgi:hypothetical protein